MSVEKTITNKIKIKLIYSIVCNPAQVPHLPGRPFHSDTLLTRGGTFSGAACQVRHTDILTRSFAAYGQVLIHTQVK